MIFVNNTSFVKGFFKNIDNERSALLIYSEVNRRYFTDFNSSDGIIVFTKEKNYLILDFRYIEAARSKVNDFEIILFDNLADTISEVLLTNGIEKVFFESEGLNLKTAGFFKKTLNKIAIDCIFDDSLDSLIRKSRMIKSDFEIEKLRQSQIITEKAFEHALNLIKPGVTEREIALEIEFYMKKNNAENIAFDLIVISGNKTSLPHGEPSDKKIEYNDFVTMDIGAVYKGYHSDMTRTVCVGKASAEQKNIYNTVLNAQLLGLDNIKPGVVCSYIDKTVRDYIYNEGFEGCFGHATGHSVGLQIHEYPNFSPNCSEILKPGMVLTVEPGIYLSGKFGVRIEDMILLNENSYENLTKVDKKLIEL